MKKNYAWLQWMIALGYAAMLLGALDPMEGSVVILAGAALMALGTYLDPEERSRLRPRLYVLVLIALGVGSLWGLTYLGGVGGTSGRSMWWGTAILPYLAGWSWGTWAKGTPRWVSWAGALAGMFFIAIPFLAMRAGRAQFVAILVVVGVTGLVTVVGCVRRLWLDTHPPAAAVSVGTQSAAA